MYMMIGELPSMRWKMARNPYTKAHNLELADKIGKICNDRARLEIALNKLLTDCGHSESERKRMISEIKMANLTCVGLPDYSKKITSEDKTNGR